MPSGSLTSGTASNRSTSGSVSTSWGSRFSMPGQFHFAGRVVNEDVLPGQPAKEVFEAAQAQSLGAPAQTFAVGFGVTPDPALIGFQDGAADLPGPAQIALDRPGQKEVHRVAPGVQGAGREVAGGQPFQIRLAPIRQRVGRGVLEQVGMRRLARRVFSNGGPVVRPAPCLWLCS